MLCQGVVDYLLAFGITIGHVIAGIIQTKFCGEVFKSIRIERFRTRQVAFVVGFVVLNVLLSRAIYVIHSPGIIARRICACQVKFHSMFSKVLVEIQM